MAKFDENKLKDSVSQLYGIDRDSVQLVPAERGKNGMFIGYIPGQPNQEIGVVNKERVHAF